MTGHVSRTATLKKAANLICVPHAVSHAIDNPRSYEHRDANVKHDTARRCTLHTDKPAQPCQLLPWGSSTYQGRILIRRGTGSKHGESPLVYPPGQPVSLSVDKISPERKTTRRRWALCFKNSRGMVTPSLRVTEESMVSAMGSSVRARIESVYRSLLLSWCEAFQASNQQEPRYGTTR